MPLPVPKTPFGVQEIEKLIPHRYPFLLIDKVWELIPGERVVATKNISYSDPWLQGHFPGNPVVPGVLIVEAMAQTGAILGHVTLERSTGTVLFAEIESTRFKRPVVPGDVLRLTVTLVRRRDPFFWFEAKAETEAGELAAVSKFSALMK